jgi:two-component system sensor histidine kinase/response regulator
MPATVLGSDPVRPDSHGTRLDHVFVPPRADPESPARVLIAEDHEDSRDALSTLLDALGYRVAVAGNGAEAVEVARREHPDVILMDMMMPRVDGFEATRTLREDPRFRDVPIIAITAMEGARQAVLEAGCSDMVVKPIDIRAFLVRLQGWLENARTP